MSDKFKAGVVVTIRVTPPDCISCVDVADFGGLYTPGMSFAQVVRDALGTLLESARQQNVIPTRDGYEFEEMVTKRFQTDSTSRTTRARKLQITALADKQAASRRSPALPQGDSVAVQRLQRRFDELNTKLEGDALNFGQTEREELEIVAAQLVAARAE